MLGGSGYSRHTVHKLSAEQNVRVVEHSVFEGDKNELGALEVSLEHMPDVLRVTEI